jgi:HK97 family phage portal protein
VFLDGQPRELYALRPDRVKVIAGAGGWPQRYEYSVAEQTVRYGQRAAGAGGAALRPINVKLPHPLNDNYGMSPIEAAIQAIDTHNAASRWNKALLDNAARPSGTLVYGPASGQMTEAQFKRLRSELEEYYQGSMNAGRPMLLEGGLDWKPLSLTPREMARHSGLMLSATQVTFSMARTHLDVAAKC